MGSALVQMRGKITPAKRKAQFDTKKKIFWEKVLGIAESAGSLKKDAMIQRHRRNVVFGSKALNDGGIKDVPGEQWEKIKDTLQSAEKIKKMVAGSEGANDFVWDLKEKKL